MGGTQTNVQLKIGVQLQHHGQYNAFINANNAARLLKFPIGDVASNLHKLQADHRLGSQTRRLIFLFTTQLSALKGECQRGHAYRQYAKRGDKIQFSTSHFTFTAKYSFISVLFTLFFVPLVILTKHAFVLDGFKGLQTVFWIFFPSSINTDMSEQNNFVIVSDLQ